MNLPKLLSIDEVAEYLDVTPATLEKWRTAGKGPNFIKAGAGIRYPENALAEYVQAQLQLPPIDGSKAATPAAIAAAMQSGSAERKAAMQERTKQLQQIDADDRVPDSEKVAGVTELTMGFAGQAPGITRCDPMTGKPIVAQTTVRDISGRSDVTVAVAPVQHGAVPVPWNKA